MCGLCRSATGDPQPDPGSTQRRVKLPAVSRWDRSGALAAFMQAIRMGQEAESSGRDNLGSVALMFAAIVSAESGQPREIGNVWSELLASRVER